jgi:hypothetical protein
MSSSEGALRAGKDELNRAHRLIAAGPLDLDVLRGTVAQTAELTSALAELATELAIRAGEDLTATELVDSRHPDAPARATIQDVVADLRTMAKQLSTARLLIEPAVADLTHLRTAAPPAVAATQSPG